MAFQQAAVAHGSVEAGTSYGTGIVQQQQQQAGVVFQPPVPPRKAGQGCDCSTPPDASPTMTLTRGLTIAIIVVHSLALVALGFLKISQWAASLCAIISGGVMLCCYDKCIYTCTPIFYIIAVVFDVLAILSWAFFSDGFYVYLLAFPALAIMVTIPGIVIGFKTCSSWSTLAGTITGPPGPVVTLVNAPPGVVVRHAPQVYHQA